MTNEKKILVAISGGVDSAVAMHLMKEAGFSVSSATLVLCENGQGEALCAKELSEKMGVPHMIYEHKKEFFDEIITDFAKTYARGETPNPCVVCNRKIKLGILCKKAKEQKLDLVATGHYAICEYSEKYGRKVIKKAKDAKKDQSYMLWQLTREQIDMCHFPLGGFTKDEVRNIAEENGFVNARKKDSQDICFIPDGDYATVVEKVLERKFADGDFVNEKGEVLGKHKGIIRYTTGQRKGLGLSLPAPLYVKEKKIDENLVVLCPEEGLFSESLIAKDVVFQAIDTINEPIRAKVKTRYSAKEADCVVSLLPDGRLSVVFDEKQRAITPGQSAVVYDDEGVLLCGGIIC